MQILVNVTVWASWLAALSCLGLLVWLGFQRRRLQDWVGWLPLPLIPALIAVGWGEPVWILGSCSILLIYCLAGVQLAHRRWRLTADPELSIDAWDRDEPKRRTRG
ncbi:MAG: hypothetical protein ACK5MP_02470 [Nostocoides sp.]